MTIVIQFTHLLISEYGLNSKIDPDCDTQWFIPETKWIIWNQVSITLESVCISWSKSHIDSKWQLN